MEAQPGVNRNNPAATYFEYLLYLLILLFYLPFIPKFFMGDDWLWLAQAEQARQNITVFFERTAYGYFRPLYVMFVSLVSFIFGRNAVPFGILAVIGHILNCFLLKRLLLRFNFSHTVGNFAVIFFGFYFISCSTICWISAGADIFMLTLMLWFTLKLVDYFDKPSLNRLLWLIVLALLATLTKEAGIVCLVLFLLYPILNKVNPFKGQYFIGTLMMLIMFTAYVVFYLGTRSVIDKEIALGAGTIVNWWYLFVYLFVPFSQRIVAILGESWLSVLTVVRGVIVFALPLVWLLLFWRRGSRERFFLLWPLLLLAPVAVFNWGFGLFDLWPERTITRFMYTAVPGVAVVLGFFLEKYIRIYLRSKIIIGAILIVFILGNLAAVYKVTGLYKNRQEESFTVYTQLLNHRTALTPCETVNILTAEPESTPEILTNPLVMDALGYLTLGEKVKVLATSEISVLELTEADDWPCTLIYDPDTRALIKVIDE